MAEGETITHGSLAGDIHLPVFGTVKKKTAAYAAGGAVVFVIVVYWTRQHNMAASGETATVSPDAIDPSIDPATGLPWADEGLGSGFGDAGSMPFPGGSNTDTGPLDDGSTAGPPFSDNSSWARYVEAAMGSTGADSIAAAIGHYLAGAELSDNEITIVQQANALGNPPPIAGPGGYPPSFRHKAVPGHPVTAHNPVKGMHVTPRSTQVDISWSAEPNAHGYLVKILGGGKVIQQATVTGTRHTFHNLKRGHHYTAQVRAQPGGSGGTDARSNFTTK
jgi:hypothetical protein